MAEMLFLLRVPVVGAVFFRHVKILSELDLAACFLIRELPPIVHGFV